MKKQIFSLVGALLALTACSDREQGLQELQASDELSFINAVDRTKGYVTGVTFYDTEMAHLHDQSPATTGRTMHISAYLTPQDGSSSDYFRDSEFSVGNDSKWHHDPAIYWPIGGHLDFLAYSSKTPFEDKNAVWNETNASAGITLDVLSDRLQDDIVFAAAQQSSSEGANVVAMAFKHAQAWIQFKVKASDATMRDKIAVKAITLKNVYTSGSLNIARTAGNAEATWNFRHEVAADLIMPDNYQLYGTQESASPYALTNALDEDARYMDVLLPDQAKTDIVITYVLAGQPNELTFRFNLPNTNTTEANWLMGKKYVYEITFSVNEITANPSVTEYVDGNVTDLTPTEVI